MSEFDEAIWNSLPIPALLVDPDELIENINPAAESFLNASTKAMRGVPVWDKITVDAPLENALRRSRDHGTPLFVNDVDIGTGEGPPIQGNIKIAPVSNKPGYMLFLITSRELAGRMTRSHGVKSSAKSAIGMAEMLAHEIKNPLAGITGAAQLLSMGLEAEDLEFTDLIVEESRRIVKLLEQVEQFGNLSPPQQNAVNIHDVLDRARRSALVGFGAHMKIVEDYDPRCRWRLGMRINCCRWCSTFSRTPRRRRRRAARSGFIPIMIIRSECGALMGRASRFRFRLRSSTMGRACRRTSRAMCLIRSFPGVRMARGSALRW